MGGASGNPNVQRCARTPFPLKDCEEVVAFDAETAFTVISLIETFFTVVAGDGACAHIAKTRHSSNMQYLSDWAQTGSSPRFS